MQDENQLKRVTIKDVAMKADVALGTVSRIINGNTTVAPELRAHVMKVIEELEYRPNATARTLRTKKTRAVGIVVTDIRQRVASEMIAAAADVVRSYGFAPIVGDFRNDVSSEEMLHRSMSERNVDGLLLTVSSDEDAELISTLKKMSIPIVLWERDAPGAFFSARSNHRLGTRLAADHLRQRGRRRVLLVAGPEHTWASREQEAGIREGLIGNFDLEILFNGKYVLSDLIDALGVKNQIDGIVASIHDIPVIMKTLQAEAVSCPKDVSVVSIGDDPFLEICAPAISAIRIQPETVGRRAAYQLMALLGEKVPENPDIGDLVQPELKIRASS